MSEASEFYKLHQKINAQHEKINAQHEVFNQHVVDCEKKFTRGADNFKTLFLAQEENTRAQQENTKAVAELIENTKAVVQLYQDLQGVGRMGKGAQGFLTWVIKWPLIGGGLYGMCKWVMNHL